MNYISSAHQKALSARYRLTALIVGALGISTILYILIGYSFAPAMPQKEYRWLSNNSLVVVVAIIVLTAVFLRRYLLSPTKLQTATQRGIGALLSNLHLSSISGAVFGDLIGILGVIASLMTGTREYSWRLGIASVLIIAYSFPRRSEWERAVARLEQNNEAAVLPKDAVRLGLMDSE